MLNSYQASIDLGYSFELLLSPLGRDAKISHKVIAFVCLWLLWALRLALKHFNKSIQNYFLETELTKNCDFSSKLLLESIKTVII